MERESPRKPVRRLSVECTAADISAQVAAIWDNREEEEDTVHPLKTWKDEEEEEEEEDSVHPLDLEDMCAQVALLFIGQQSP